MIGGTIGDASATTTDASNPVSGASTPPTSASDTETPAPTKGLSDKKKKRKREEGDAAISKKVKSDVVESKHEQSPVAVTGKDLKAVTRKLAKLRSEEKADYETRAKAKGQTLEQYVLRRIQKKAETRAPKPVEVIKEKKSKSDKKEKKSKKAQ